MTKTNRLFRFQTIPSFLIQSDTIDFLSPALLSAGRGHCWSMTFSFFELSRWNGNHNTWLTLTLEVSGRGWGSTTDPSCPSVTVIIKLIILAAQRHRNSATNAVPLFQCCNTGSFCVEPCASIVGARRGLILMWQVICVAYGDEILRYI